MPIQILPARLANQIAAGEVVERPASVVKELVENSLDSGATAIDIEIEKGGHKRVLIRDNGKGIPQQELALALSRHATSKIAKLDDLEAICSLGFRGEALASISSVARLTLSSKPETQSQAWQAHSEGRDMQVQLNPVAHPVGTSVEVLDLFFNTPARRKFLRTEKTEFAHIDELVRRIALSRFDVAFSLKHNGKLLRKYPVAVKVNPMKRVAAICGQSFAEHGIELNSQYQEYTLKGWFAPPEYAKPQADFQYFYVNGRMMRDKLINHALRQAFEGVTADNLHNAYVLYLTLPPEQVDVNVHPAKHEVRFHQARLVHDFIFRALNDGLNQYWQQGRAEAQPHILKQVEPSHDYIIPLKSQEQKVSAGVEEEYAADQRATQKADLTSKIARQQSVQSAAVITELAKNYQQLMSTPEYTKKSSASSSEAKPNSMQVDNQKSVDDNCLGQWLRVADKQMLVKAENNFYLLDIATLQQHILLARYVDSMPTMQPLLMPVSITASGELLASVKRLYQPLLENSVEIGWTPNRIILRKVPAEFRHIPWGEILELALECKEVEVLEVRKHLFSCIVRVMNYSNAHCESLLRELSLSPANTRFVLDEIAKKVSLEQWLNSHD